MGILLGDGTPPGLHDVRAFLEREGFEILGETGDGPELVQLAVGLRPALVIFDDSTPRMSALEAAHEILDLCRETRVILLSSGADEDEIVAAFRAGVRGYVVRADAQATLVRAIREVTGGRIFLSPGASRVLAQEWLPPTDSPPPVLP